MKVGDIVKIRDDLKRWDSEQWAIGKLFVVTETAPALVTVRNVSNLREMGYLRIKRLEVVNEDR